MEIRRKALSELHTFIKGVDQQVTTILKNLQWDRKCLLEDAPKVTCSYHKSHKLSPTKKESHESCCFLKSHGYEKDLLLPDPLDVNASTLVKLDKKAIITIINNASCGNPAFKQGNRSQSPEPWTLERLQATYTADERLALHNAVVQAVPSCHDLADLALPSKEDGDGGQRTKSRAEILAELRDMKRRRAKYRVAAKTRKYSDVLSDVIKTQMELYTGAAQTTTKSDLSKSIQIKEETSVRNNMDRQSRGDYSSKSHYETRNRSRENRTESERVRTSLGDGRDRRQPNEKNKDRTTSTRMRTSTTGAKERYTREDCSYTSRYERKMEKNVSTEQLPSRDELKRYYSGASSYANKREEEQEAVREKRNQIEHSSTYRYGENHDNPSRNRKENGNSNDYPSKSKRTRRSSKTRANHYDYNYKKSKRRESSGSSESNYTSSKRKERDSRERYKSSRKRDRDSDTRLPIKTERDETLGRESIDRDTRSINSYSSTNRSNRHPEYNSVSESDVTSRRKRHRKDKDDYYKTIHNIHRHNETNERIKMEKEDTPAREFLERDVGSDRRTSKSNRKRDKRRRSRSSEESYEPSRRGRGSRPSKRSRERENRQSTSCYKNKPGDTGVGIKTERDSTPEQESCRTESHYPVYASTHRKHIRRDSNSSWE